MNANIQSNESINLGKNSYKDYLKEYKKKTRGNQAKLMKQARITLKKIKRSKDYCEVNMIDYDFDF